MNDIDDLKMKAGKGNKEAIRELRKAALKGDEQATKQLMHMAKQEFQESCRFKVKLIKTFYFPSTGWWLYSIYQRIGIEQMFIDVVSVAVFILLFCFFIWRKEVFSESGRKGVVSESVSFFSLSSENHADDLTNWIGIAMVTFLFLAILGGIHSGYQPDFWV